MTTRRKLWTAIASFALVLVVAATAVGVTIAALQAQVGSGFSISYTAHNVNALIVGRATIEVECEYGTAGFGESYAKAYVPIKSAPFVSTDGKHILFNGGEDSKKFTDVELKLESSEIDSLADAYLKGDFGVDLIKSGDLRVTLQYVVVNFDTAATNLQLELKDFEPGEGVEVSHIVFDGTSAETYGDEDELPAKVTVPASGFTSAEEFVSTAKALAEIAFEKTWDEFMNLLSSSEYMALAAFGADFSGDDLAVAAAMLNAYGAEFGFTNFATYTLQLDFAQTVSADLSGKFNFTLGQV